MLMYTKLQALDKEYSDASNFLNSFYLKLQLFFSKKNILMSVHIPFWKKNQQSRKSLFFLAVISRYKKCNF